MLEYKHQAITTKCITDTAYNQKLANLPTQQTENIGKASHDTKILCEVFPSEAKLCPQTTNMLQGAVENTKQPFL